jgi:hypothetical protein
MTPLLESEPLSLPQPTLIEGEVVNPTQRKQPLRDIYMEAVFPLEKMPDDPGTKKGSGGEGRLF